MGYSNTGKPVFYVSVLQWLKSIGQLEEGMAGTSGGDGTVISDKDRLDIVDMTSPGQMEWYEPDTSNRWIVVYRNKLLVFI